MQHRRGHLVVRGVDAGGGGTRRPALWATRMVQWRTQQRRGRPRRRQLGAIHSSLVGSCRWCAPSSADCRGRLAVLSKEQGATCQIGFPEPSACEAKAARSPIGASAAETSRRRGCRGAVQREVQWCRVVAPVSDDGDQQRTLAFVVACLTHGSERSRAGSKRSIPDPGTRTRILPESRGTARPRTRRRRSQERQERHSPVVVVGVQHARFVGVTNARRRKWKSEAGITDL